MSYLKRIILKQFTVLLLVSMLVVSVHAQIMPVAPMPGGTELPLPNEPTAATSYFGASIGAGFPTGNYSATDIANNASGFALTGYNFNLSAGMLFKHTNFGIAAKIDHGNNPFNVSSLASSMLTYYPNLPWESEADGKYSYTTILVGGYHTFFLDRFSIDIRLLGGIMFADIPTVAVESNQIVDSLNVTFLEGISAAKSAALAFDVGAGVRYSLSSNTCIMFNIDYMASNPSFTTTQDIVQIVNGIVQEEQANNTFNQPFNLINATVGIAWQF